LSNLKKTHQTLLLQLVVSNLHLGQSCCLLLYPHSVGKTTAVWRTQGTRKATSVSRSGVPTFATAFLLILTLVYTADSDFPLSLL